MKNLTTYYKKIYRLLPCDKKQKLIILEGLKNDIAELQLLNPTCIFEEIQDKFGTPEDFTHSYYDEIPSSELEKKLSQQKLFKALIVIASFCIILVSAYFLHLIWEHHQSVPSYYIETLY